MAQPTFVLDTNIIVSAIVNADFDEYFTQNYLLRYRNFVISAVTEGELRAIASKRKWGNRKLDILERVLESFLIYPVKLKSVINSYAELDTYSQGLLDAKPLPKGMSSRNMGKNDLWIAATAQVLKATLVTTDKDFDHLAKVYFPIDFIDVGMFK